VCQNGGCCPLPLPTCPNTNIQANKYCSGPGTCPAGQICHVDNRGQKGCCDVPTCPNGVPSVQPCNAGSSCPMGMHNWLDSELFADFDTPQVCSALTKHVVHSHCVPVVNRASIRVPTMVACAQLAWRVKMVSVVPPCFPPVPMVFPEPKLVLRLPNVPMGISASMVLVVRVRVQWQPWLRLGLCFKTKIKWPWKQMLCIQDAPMVNCPYNLVHHRMHALKDQDASMVTAVQIHQVVNWYPEVNNNAPFWPYLFVNVLHTTICALLLAFALLAFVVHHRHHVTSFLIMVWPWISCNLL